MESSGEPQTKRLRILALHGAKANNETTRIQLQNLQISEEKYDLVYLRGVVEDAEGHEDLADLVSGPFYSWIDDTSDESRVQSIHRSVLNVYHVIRDMGPFDGIFAFSSGAVIATIVMNMLHDETLREKFLGQNQSSIKELKQRLEAGIDKYIQILGYYSRNIKGSNKYWLAKTRDLESWTQHHISWGHGPLAFFITFACFRTGDTT